MKTLKNKLLVSFISMLVLCLTLAFAFSFNATKVQATVDNDAFVMVEGASVATNKDGIRFRVQMGQNVYDKVFTNDANDDVKLSVLIAPETFFDDLAETANAGKYQQLAKKVEVKIDDVAKVYKQGDYYFANAVLTNLAVANNNAITEDQFDLEFVAVGCIATTTGSETTYEYTSLSEARTQYQVAQSAILDVEDITGEYAKVLLAENSPYKTWLGKEEHPIVIDTLDEFNSLTTKISNGVDFDANVEIYHKFETPETDVTLPVNTTNFYYVNFYNKDTLLETVEVEEGYEAEISFDYPKYDALEAMNGAYVRGYKFGGWVTTNGGTESATFTDVQSNFNAYIKWTWGDHTAQLLSEAKAEEPNGVLFFDREVGISQFGCNNGVDFTRSYDTTVKWGNEKGSTKLFFENTIYEAGEQVNNPWISVDAYTGSASTGDWILFHVYVDFGDEVTYVDIKHSNTPGVRIFNKTWGSVIFPASGFGSSALRLEIAGKNADGSSSGSFYLSKATFVSSADAYNLSAITVDNTLKIGNVELTGVSNYNYEGLSTKGTHKKTPNDAVFTQEFNYEPYYIDGEIFYYHQNNRDGGLWLNFKEGINSKLYITARGLGDTPGIYAWNTAGSLVLGGWTNPVSVVDGANGYRTYCYDFTGKDLSKLRFHTAEEATRAGFRQVAISDIRVGA